MILKRVMDLFFSFFGLVILSPVFLVIAIWIKLDSKGPVFYKQVRVGKNMEPFKIFKFRTMIYDPYDKGLQLTTSDDKRITRSGRFLRKTKLDELPQLINVFIGEMSLVGPRPEVPKYVRYYPEEVRKIVLSVPPGITDRASLEFKNENEILNLSKNPEKTYIDEILPVKLKYYVGYVENRTLLGDIKIIIDTFLELI
jgi:lipopolysaccharide/colanic/teichoic acid biosynthesis glycosyltransferase